MRRRWLAPLLWTAFALVLAGLGAMMLRACGMNLWGWQVFDFCPLEAEAPDGPPKDLLVLVAERDNLEDRLSTLRLELASLPQCPVIAQAPEPPPPPPP
ncbi:MAG TPA: hypothetical protein VJL84_00005, partial [Kiloniellales bacterium]|nr:hypothetical protein [Kiloniellales bacterium]